MKVNPQQYSKKIHIKTEDALLLECNTTVVRKMIAQDIPGLVLHIWTEDYLRLPFPPYTDKLNLQKERPSAPWSDADRKAVQSTKQLLETLISRTKITSTSFLLGLFLIHRYRSIPEANLGRNGSQYRMFLIGLLLAHKYTEDHPFSNRLWAQLSEMPLTFINEMERNFLQAIEHRLMVSLDEFEEWVVGLDRRFTWTTIRRLPASLSPTVAPLVQQMKFYDLRNNEERAPPRYNETSPNNREGTGDDESMHDCRSITPTDSSMTSIYSSSKPFSY